MSKKKPWRYSESRPIRPFKVSEHALVKTAFRTRKDMEFLSDDPWRTIVEPEEIKHESFAPCFAISIDIDMLSSDTGLDIKDLVLGVTLRDPALLRSTLLNSWGVEDSPEIYSISHAVLGKVSGNRGIELELHISPAESLTPKFRTASLPGQIVSSRVFKVDTPLNGAGFPVQPVDAEYFEELGLPKETVWVIKWMSSDFDRPAEEILCVLINKDEAEKILRLSGGDSVGRVLWSEIAVEAFLEVCLAVFSSDPQAPETNDSLLAKVFARLKKETGLSFDELILKAKSDDKFRFFRAHLQKNTELGNRIRHIRLAGRAQ